MIGPLRGSQNSTQRLGAPKGCISVNICSMESNSSDIFVCKVAIIWKCREEDKMNAHYFREEKTAVLGAQLQFLKGNCQLLTS